MLIAFTAKLFFEIPTCGKHVVPTQDKNRPKADFCPSWFIIFGQHKSCAPSYQDIHIGGGQQQKNGAKSSKP